MATTEIYGFAVVVGAGSVIEPDGWQISQRLEESSWDAAEFRIPTGHAFGVTSLAVNVTVTGRTWVSRCGDLWTRVKIEFVGDGEPSVMHKGWMLKTA